jgi:hypothetical protein
MNINDWDEEASLTVEAALVLPVFIYFLIAFLYFIQIFTIQEQIQSTITKIGLNLSKTAYIYKDMPSIDEAFSLDISLFGTEIDIGLDELTASIINGGMLKLYSREYLDTEQMNRSCIQNGFDGISFIHSSVFDQDDYIDLVAEYTVNIPIKLFVLEEMHIIQRVRMRSWTGYEVEAAYTTQKESDNDDVTIVYITDSGSVYHVREDCSHIKLSVIEVPSIPVDRRNDNGGKYYPCEACCNGEEMDYATYYITSDGMRYHTKRTCSKIKRSVKEIPLSEVGDRAACKRCGQLSSIQSE